MEMDPTDQEKHNTFLQDKVCELQKKNKNLLGPFQSLEALYYLLRSNSFLHRLVVQSNSDFDQCLHQMQYLVHKMFLEDMEQVVEVQSFG
jgi:hypothetical protein